MKNSGPEVLNGLKNWWKGPAKSATEIGDIFKRSPIESIIADMDIFKSKMAGEFEGLTNQLASSKSIIEGRSQLQSWLAERTRELDRLNRKLISRRSRVIKGPEEAAAIGREVDALTDVMTKLKRDINIMKGKEKKLNEFQMFIENAGPHKALELLKNDPNLKRKIPGLDEWFKDADKLLAEWHQNYKLTSGNLDKAKKFVKEMKLYADRDPKFLAKFLENPANQAYLSVLRTTGPRSVRELIAKIEGVTLKRPNLLGSATEIAKKLGIGLGLVGSGIAAIKLFGWFDKNAKEGATKSTGLLNALNSVKTSGPGITILNNAKKSANSIKQLSNQLDSGMDKDPEKATKAYLSGVAQEIGNLSNVLKQWNIVVKYSDNKEVAEQVGTQIADYIRVAQENLVKLGASVGQNIRTQSVERYAPPSDTEIKKIQMLLRQRGYNIQITGEVDNSTITALSSLEREFAEENLGMSLSGKFVNKDNNTIIPYNNLVRILNILEK